ncbi:putative Amino acid transporter [Spironucleus salmonicida]|uniref:Amino acid transporter n=1 Tax=Spironucleus salmonicida TaxID=348837 RepID=V6M0W2_9EUKA|nr:putative Amino acid transporter [Spironucleus salmonicida]|eukprot:EST46784.1 Amino acid transporter family protein [Spironucleus salmonicida]
MKTYKAYTASAMMINFAIGTGVLNLPKTVARASIIVSFILLTIVTFGAYLLGRYTLDALARTFAIKRAQQCLKEQISTTTATAIPNIEENIVLHNGQEDTVMQTEPDYSLPNDYTYEFSELCEIHWGKAGFIIYQITIILYIFGTLWGYTSVVAQSMSSVVPFGSNWECADPCGTSYAHLCNVAYYVWTYVALVYCSIMIFFDLSKQKILQAIFTIFRFVSVGGIALIAFIAIFIGPFNTTSVTPAPPVVSKTAYIQDTPLFAFTVRSFGSIFSSSTFAIILHHCIPNVLKPVQSEQQKYLNHSFTGTFVFLYFIMAFVAYPSALYFGTEGSQLITLNLIKWDGKNWNATSQPVWAAIIAYGIRVLPPIYVLGAIPINGFSMCYNVLAIFPQMREKKWFAAVIKLVCVIPPMILAGFFRCIGDIIDLTGLFGFIILVSPAFILIKAKKTTKQLFGSVKTSYSGFCDQDWLIIVVMCFNGIGFGFTLFAVIMNFIGPP